MRTQIAVCGPSDASLADERAAYRVGELLADRGAVVICGGGDGVMAAVAAGAASRSGLVIGVRPDLARDTGLDLSATIRTNMGEARNAIIVASADAVIAVGGSWGTLSEVALAMRAGRAPVVCLNGWQVRDHDGQQVPGLITVTSPEEAVAAALNPVT